jgi:hypothetical protein
MPIKDESAKRVCVICGDDVESCGFCEREDCSKPVCYRCLRFELRQSRRPLEDRTG